MDLKPTGIHLQQPVVYKHSSSFRAYGDSNVVCARDLVESGFLLHCTRDNVCAKALCLLSSWKKMVKCFQAVLGWLSRLRYHCQRYSATTSHLRVQFTPGRGDALAVSGGSLLAHVPHLRHLGASWFWCPVIGWTNAASLPPPVTARQAPF